MDPIQPTTEAPTMVIYASACEDCQFTFKSGCDSTTHTVAERHAAVRGHVVVYGSYDERRSTAGAR